MDCMNDVLDAVEDIADEDHVTQPVEIEYGSDEDESTIYFSLPFSSFYNFH